MMDVSTAIFCSISEEKSFSLLWHTFFVKIGGSMINTKNGGFIYSKKVVI